MNYFSSDFTLGILGGGQLGKMLLQVTSKLSIKTNILDPNKDSPCKNLCNEFTNGNLMDFNSVYEFGKKCDIVTFEIEHVNIEALEKLEADGITVYPRPKTLKIIQDKSLQKQFFIDNKIPTANFWYFKSFEDFQKSSFKDEISFPCVWKKTKFGYDGYGVEIIKSSQEIENLPDSEFIIEELIPFKKELATTIVRNKSGEIEVFPLVQMDFNKQSNQVEYVICPAQVDRAIIDLANSIALKVSKSFEHIGLLAIEMFLTEDNKILINEVAPRPHNSAHYSIEACENSQFQQHINSIFNFKLGSSKTSVNAIMVNLVGEKGFSGPVLYNGIEKAMEYGNVSVHIYGKSETKPNRKMGHATIIDKDLKSGLEKAKSIKNIIKIKTK